MGARVGGGLGVEVFQDASSHTFLLLEDLDMSHATYAAPDLTLSCRLNELGLEAVGQHLEPGQALLECRVIDRDDRCQRCGAEGVPRDSVIRRLAYEPFGHRPTTLLVRVRRYRCSGCGRTWRKAMTVAAEPRAKISRGGVRWALKGIVLDPLSVSRVAAGLGVSWHTANTAVLAEGKRVLIDNPARFDGVTTIGIDEHVWRHTRKDEKYVTVIIDLTPVWDKTGSTASDSPPTPWTGAGSVSSGTPSGIEDGPVTPSTGHAGPCTPATHQTGSPLQNPRACRGQTGLGHLPEAPQVSCRSCAGCGTRPKVRWSAEDTPRGIIVFASSG